MEVAKIVWTFAVLLSAIISMKFFKRFIQKLAQRKEVPIKRLYYITKVFDIFFIMMIAVIIALIWSVDIKGISVFASSIFAIAGVAMFAQWSILSNVTASIIIFFTFPARIGEKIRIIDGDDTIEGTIIEITLFQTALTDDSGNTILYPNNLILQKPVIKLK